MEPLGKNAKTLDRELTKKKSDATVKMRKRRTEALRLQRKAAEIIPKERVSKCRWVMISRVDGVGVFTSTYGENPQKYASFGGLQTCGSVWHCPCCSRRISEVRRAELNLLLAWARKNSLIPVMLTLTARHRKTDDLAEQLDKMKRAKVRFRQRNEWRRMKEGNFFVGSVTATEVTYGEKHGWHTHFHEIILTNASGIEVVIPIFEQLNRVWRTCLRGRGIGLDCTLKNGLQVQGAETAGNYVAKWGAAEELALSGSKAGRKAGENGQKGKSPMELLALAADGDNHATQSWWEYALAFKGRRQLSWSPGLKALVGIGDVNDIEVAGDEAQDEQQRDDDPIVSIPADQWDRGKLGGLRHRRSEILEAAEQEGATGVLRMMRPAVHSTCRDHEAKNHCDGDEPLNVARWVLTEEEQEFLDFLGPPTRKPYQVNLDNVNGENNDE